MAEAGARGTAWDLLWDVEEENEYYLHVENDGSAKQYPKVIAVVFLNCCISVGNDRMYDTRTTVTGVSGAPG